MAEKTLLRAKGWYLFVEGCRPAIWEVQAREPMFGSSKVNLALRESARATGQAGAEDLIHIVRGFAVRVIRTECQLMPELIRPKLKLQTVVVGDSGIRAVPEDAFIAV